MAKDIFQLIDEMEKSLLAVTDDDQREDLESQLSDIKDHCERTKKQLRVIDDAMDYLKDWNDV